MECSVECTEGLGADRLTGLGAGPRLGQIRAKAISAARSLVRGNRWDSCFIEGGSGRLGREYHWSRGRETHLAGSRS